MPRRDDLHKILVLGSGPIVIGQAAEFDYSGAQACKVLLEEGYEVVLVNSNPATIMTDPEFATATYVEPLLPEVVAQVIERERPDALLPTLGGQTALNLAKALFEDGTLERFGVELIGANYDAINRAEDRELFDATMQAAGLRTARNTIATSVDEARGALADFGLPLIIRPAFTLGGRGGGIARTEAEFERIVAQGLAASPIGQVLIDESVLGWGEFELEVMRDRADNVVIVCSIENVDPMGVHTGDSVTVAPQMSLTDRQYQMLRDQAIAVIRAVGVETGGSNVQFAVNPQTDEIVVIEMNPRVSRSSALASKATGLPDRQDRGAAGGRLHARRDPERHHAQDAGVVRADDRLRGRQVAAVRVREVPGRRRPALDAHEVGRRGDGDRPDVQAGVRQGDALARDRRRRRPVRRPAGAARDARRGPVRPAARGVPAGRVGGGGPRAHVDRPVVPAGAARARARARGGRDRRPDLPRRRHVRGRVRGRDAVLLLRLGAAGRGRCPARGPARRPAERDDPRLRPQPHRPGDRVRLLLRARRDDRAGVRPRRGDGQLQPGDGLDRLRHVRPAVLRAADARRRARDRRGRAARGRDRAVRRPDAAEARSRARGGRRAAARAPRPRRSTSPRTAGASAPCWNGSAWPRRRTRWRAAPRRRSRPRPASASRCSCGRATCSAAARWSSSTRPRRSPTTCSARARTASARSSSTASWRTRSRSTSTRSATARTSGSAGSCSTSRRPGSTPATRPACCRRTRSATRCCARSARRPPRSRSSSASSG